MLTLSSGKFLLRPFTPENIPDFVAAVLQSTTTLGKWMSWANDSYSVAQAASWFAYCDKERENKTSFELGIFEAKSGSLVGGCGLNQFNHINSFCNLGYWVRESHQRQGAGLAAITALSQFGFTELNLGRIEIVVASDNAPSIALAEKAGALRECLARNRMKVHGSLVDAYVFSIIP
jgi:ribosomal-protein-serine acetyltransferase